MRELGCDFDQLAFTVAFAPEPVLSVTEFAIFFHVLHQLTGDDVLYGFT